MNTKYGEPSVSISLLLLRLVSGSAMLVNHGLKKVTNFNAILSKGFADPFHIGAKASLGLTIFAEVFCTALIIIGLLTKIAAIPLIIVMLVAFSYAHGGAFFGDGENAVVYLTMYLVILLMGPGKYSADKMIRK